MLGINDRAGGRNQVERDAGNAEADRVSRRDRVAADVVRRAVVIESGALTDEQAGGADRDRDDLGVGQQDRAVCDVLRGELHFDAARCGDQVALIHVEGDGGILD